MTIAGMMQTVCFLLISRAEVKPLSKERPPHKVLSVYVLFSILLQSALHLATMLYVCNLSFSFEPRDEVVDFEKEFAPSLLNTS